MLPYYISTHAKHRVDELIDNVTLSYVQEFPWEEFFCALCGPHMSAYNTLPTFMRENSDTRRPDVGFKVDNQTIIPLLRSDRRGLPVPTKKLPLGYNALALTLKDVPASHRLAFVELATSIDKVTRKSELLAQVVGRICNSANTPAQACSIWPPFRALLPKASSRRNHTVTTVSERGRPDAEMRGCVSESDKLLATNIFAEFEVINNLFSIKK